MLQNLQPLLTRVLDASGETMGRVVDFLFDDATWMLRYAVVDTGSWLPGRQVLLGEFAFQTRAFGRTPVLPDFLRATVTRREVEESPFLAPGAPVSREFEAACHRHFGWPAYWAAEPQAERGGPPFAGTVRPFDDEEENHLRRVSALANCRVEGVDGMLGSVSGFAIESRTWELCRLSVEAGHWYSGKAFQLWPEAITRFSARDSTLWVNLTRVDVRKTLGPHLALDGPDDRRARSPTPLAPGAMAWA